MRISPTESPAGLFQRLITYRSAYLTAAIAGGILVICLSAHKLFATPIPLPWLIMVGFTVLSGTATLRIPNISVAFSISDCFTISAALLFGPAAGTVAVALDSLVISLQLARRKCPPERLLFNATVPALAMWSAAHIFFWLNGNAPIINPAVSLGRLVGPLLIFATLYFVLNTGSIALALALDQRVSPVGIWRRHFLPLWLTYFGGAAVAGLVIALVSTRNDLVSLVLIAPMPFVLYMTFKGTVGRISDEVAHLSHVNKMYWGTIETLAHAINAKDGATHEHIRRVQNDSMRLAKALGITDDLELRAIEAASLLHDTGKLAVPEHILNKPGRLTPAEYEKMKTHATIGADILSSVDFPYPVVPIVRHHHENWDGTGYPAGLKGTEIPIGARILSVVDCFDALTSDRPYRPKMSDAEARAIVEQRSGTMYDPDLVDAFMKIQGWEDPAEMPTLPTSEVLRAAAQTSEAPGNVRYIRDAASARTDRKVLLALYELGSTIATADDPAILADRLHAALKQFMPAACTALYTYNTHTDGLTACGVSGHYVDAVNGLTMQMGERLTGWVAAQETTIVNSDAALDFGSFAESVRPRPHLCLSTALRAHDRLVGVITVYSADGKMFADTDAAILETLAPRIAEALAFAVEHAGHGHHRAERHHVLTALRPVSRPS